ncbi:MAG: hypothetical protein FWE13_02360 [Firmicutes bacterium]|nr:hypothetical protein [Bacillota bacterium]
MQKYIHAPIKPRTRAKIQNFGQGMNVSIDKAILPIGTASEVFNFDFSTGALTEGYGLESVSYINRPISEIWTFRRFNFDTNLDEEILMYRTPLGEIFYNKNGIETSLGITISGTVRTVNYRLYGDDVILLTSSTDPMWVWDGVNIPYSVPNAPKITSLTIHFERMFATTIGESNAVYFSRDLDPTNWDLSLDRGGFIQVLDERGKLNRVFSYQNFVYILRDFGISRLSAFADQTDFSVSNLFVSSGRIFSDSASLCGDRIIFLASDGLYQFDGISTSRIMQRLDGVMKPSKNSSSAFFNGRYYLSFRMSNRKAGEDNENNNALLVYEIQTGLFSILKDVCIKSFNVCGDKLYGVTGEGTACYITKCGEIFGEATVKSWVSGDMDFGTENIKRIREIFLTTDYPISVSIISERGKKEFCVTPNPGGNRIRVNLSGRKITIGIRAETSKVRVNRPTVVFTS